MGDGYSPISFPNLICLACAVIIVAVISSYLKDTALQDWVERCSFGKLTQQRYPTLVTEQQELMNAYKGMGA